METKKLTLQDMEVVEGGNRKDMLDCLAQGVSGAGFLMAVAAATGPLGWGFAAVAGLGYALSIAANPGAC